MDPRHGGVNCTATCGSPQYLGDGYCDDDNNVCGCNWDNGDCCTVDETANDHCSVCMCLDRTSVHYATAPCSPYCAHPTWSGDGFCDDDNNVRSFVCVARSEHRPRHTATQ